MCLFMHSVKADGLTLLRNGDLNFMQHFDSSSEFWSEFGGLHYKYKESIELADISEDKTDRFRDKMLFFGSTKTVEIENIEARDNWFWEP